MMCFLIKNPMHISVIMTIKGIKTKRLQFFCILGSKYHNEIAIFCLHQRKNNTILLFNFMIPHIIYNIAL